MDAPVLVANLLQSFFVVCMDVTKLMKRRTNLKRKRRTNTHTPPPTEPIPELPSEIVSDILARLPVKSLLRCKSVCKAWRAMVTDPFFIRAHLQRSASRTEENPCLILTPHTVGQPSVSAGSWPTTFSNHIRFYLWRQGVSMAALLHDKDFGNEFRCLRRFAQCDGLVLVPTDTKLYLFNPATRETVTLPDGRRGGGGGGGGSLRSCCLCVNLGLEPRTGKYKVVRAWLRSFAQFRTQRRAARTQKSELDAYLEDEHVRDDEDFEILSWWKTNKNKYPILSAMARDFLAVPLSTVSSESAFSLSGETLGDNRSSMTPETLEALVCVKDWLYKYPVNDDRSVVVIA